LSRIAIIARPVRVRLGDDEALHAAGPVLESSELQELRHRDREREGGEREINAAEPQGRKPEQEAEDEAHAAGERQRQEVVYVAVFHQDRRGVGADREERAVAERELAARTGQDVQRHDRDAVDDDLRELKHHEVAHEERRRNHQGERDQARRARNVQRLARFLARCSDRGAWNGFLNSAHLSLALAQTR
jgi:hypothetical protein